MQSFSGNIEKMRTDGVSPVQYRLVLGTDSIAMNELLGKEVTIRFDKEINCVVCNKKIPKAYGQGFCYPCFSESPENAECIIRPEVCQGHLGKGRNPAWEHDRHVKEHYVYLALSSAVKVGVTRDTQIPTRWIDQGAWKAVLLAKVPYRKLAGLIETELKKHLSDKTNWQQMLVNGVDTTLDLVAEKQRIAALLPPELREYVLEETLITEISYPVAVYPEKVQSISLDKQPEIRARMTGIKGQYLIFEGGNVLNVRAHSGYKVTISYDLSA